jgi:hypothetical protein
MRIHGIEVLIDLSSAARPRVGKKTPALSASVMTNQVRADAE